MPTTTITSKEETLYVAYAPELEVSAWGSCRDEALNNLAAEIQQHAAAADAPSAQTN
jgi:hypothetical protein